VRNSFCATDGRSEEADAATLMPGIHVSAFGSPLLVARC
jgi:hypothetical protein